MIQIIGLMIGAYIVVRCVEILSRKTESFDSEGWSGSVKVLAMLVGIFAIYGCYTLMKTGDDVGDKMAAMRSRFGAPE